MQIKENLIKKILRESITFNDNDSGLYVPKIQISDTFYHGTSIGRNENFFIPTTEYSDFEALWVTDDETIAKEFAENNAYDNDILLVFKGIVNSDSIAYIDLKKFKEIIEFYDLYDFRDSISFLNDKYDGWLTIGSIDTHIYNDYALFDDDLFDIKNVKFIVNDNESDYIDIDNAENYYLELIN